MKLVLKASISSNLTSSSFLRPLLWAFFNPRVLRQGELSYKAKISFIQTNFCPLAPLIFIYYSLVKATTFSACLVDVKNADFLVILLQAPYPTIYTKNQKEGTHTNTFFSRLDALHLLQLHSNSITFLDSSHCISCFYSTTNCVYFFCIFICYIFKWIVCFITKCSNYICCW